MIFMRTGSMKLNLKYPIVLVHGLGAKRGFGPIDYFYLLGSLLEEWGNTVYQADLSIWNGSDVRAEQLKSQILEHFPDSKVNLIGHSMGGIDARYMAAHLNVTDRIASITTIGTPNFGCAMVDYIMEAIPEAGMQITDKIISLFGLSHNGFKQLSSKFFNQGIDRQPIPDVPALSYYSIAGAIPEPIQLHSLPVFWKTHKILREIDGGDNDGFVSVKSASHGELIGVYPFDHYRQIGHLLTKKQKVQYLSMARDMVSLLASRGH